MSTDQPVAGFGSSLVVGWGDPLSRLKRHVLNGATMGTRYSAVFFGPAGLDIAPIHRALQGAVDAVDNQMSTWKPDSSLSEFNWAPPGVWVDIPDGLATVISVAIAISRESGGAFDIGVGESVNAWGFGPAGVVPDSDRIRAIASMSRRPAAEILDLDLAGRRLLKHEPLTLDLSGIAKGFGADELAAQLERHGIGAYLVSIDGEMRARGLKPGGEPWLIAIERPDPGTRDAESLIALTDMSIATSGDYRHLIEFEGQSLAHTIDPRTGRPVANSVASVTVLAAEGVRADAWATALMVLGEVDGPRCARERGIDALFFIRDAHGLREIALGQPWL